MTIIKNCVCSNGRAVWLIHGRTHKKIGGARAAAVVARVSKPGATAAIKAMRQTGTAYKGV